MGENTKSPIGASLLKSEQESEVANGLSTYLASVTAQPEHASILGVFATGVDPRILSSIANDPSALITETNTPPWFNELPDDVQRYFGSIQTAESDLSKSIVSSLSSASEAAEASAKAEKGSGSGAGRVIDRNNILAIDCIRNAWIVGWFLVSLLLM